MMPTLLIAAGFALGLGLGLIHFASLKRVAELYVGGGSLGRALGLQLLRLAILTGLLVLLARQGAAPLLAGALGIIVARWIVLRRARKGE